MAKWVKGQSGNPAGPRPGMVRAATAEVRALSRRLFNAEFWEATHARMIEGKEHPAITALLLKYAYGEPLKAIDAANVGVIVQAGMLQAPAIEMREERRSEDRELRTLPSKDEVETRPAEAAEPGDGRLGPVSKYLEDAEFSPKSGA